MISPLSPTSRIPAPQRWKTLPALLLALLGSPAWALDCFVPNANGSFTIVGGSQNASFTPGDEETDISVHDLVLPKEISHGQGSLIVDFSLPKEESNDRQSLVRLESADGLIELCIQRGMIAAYIGKPAQPLPTIIDRGSQSWRKGARHTVELRWLSRSGKKFAVMMSDGELSGAAEITDIPSLVGGRATLGGGIDGAWAGKLHLVELNPDPVYPEDLLPGSRRIMVNVEQELGNAYRFWSVANWNQPHLLSDPKTVRGIPALKPFISEINCVYLLGGRWEGENEWFQGIGSDGEVLADFSGMIEQLHGVLAAGYRPRIVLDNVPFGMSDPVTMHAFGNTAPPINEEIWGIYVEKAVRAMVEAFGKEMVAEWSFRVGTEPDLNPGHWSGTPERFLEHYDHTVEAVARVLPEAQVGPGNILNPAVSDNDLELGMKWGLSIIDHAATGVNAVTGEQGSHLDWFSYTWYGRVGSSLDLFDKAYKRTRAWLNKYPEFRNVPISIGEFAVLGDEYGRRLYAGDTTEWAASFYAALAERAYVHGIEHVYEWDQATHGVYHPRAHVIGMLDKMADGKLLKVTTEGDSAARCSAISVRKGNRLYVLLFNHRPWRSPKVSEKVELELVNLHAIGDTHSRRWRVSEWTIDENKTVWIDEFEADALAAGLERRIRAGSYEGNPFRSFGEEGLELFLQNIERYKELSALPMTRHAEVLEMEADRTTIQLEMAGHSVRFLEIWPAEEKVSQ